MPRYREFTRWWREKGRDTVSAAQAADAITIYQASVTLTDAQIKALPTTPVEIVAAQAGKILVPTSALFVSTIVDAYTGPGNGPSVDASPGDGLVVSDTSLLSASQVVIGTVTTGFGLTDWSEDALVVTTPDPSNYTGGNAANTLKVTVWYGIFEV